MAVKGLRAVMAALRGVLPGKEIREVATGRMVLQLSPGLSDKEKELTRAAAAVLVEVEAEAARVRLGLRLALEPGADPAVQLEALRAALAWLE